MNKYLKFEFWNNCDLGDVVFTAFGFRFWFYLDALVTEPEHLTIEEVEKDGEEREIKTFIKAVKRYRIVTPLIPEYMVDAINRMKLHDNIRIVFLNEESEMLTRDQVTVETEYIDESTCFAKCTIMFDIDETVIKTNCCMPLINCIDDSDCDVIGVLYDPQFNDKSIIESLYPTVTTGDLFLLLTEVYAGVYTSECNVAEIAIRPGSDDVNWHCNECFDDPTGKMILTADGERWYNNGTYWYRVFTIEGLSTYAVIPPPAFDWLTIFTGFSLPGTFVQIQRRPAASPTWADFGTPVTADDFQTTGARVYHSLHGNYYFRVKIYSHSCEYSDYGVSTGLVVFP